MEILTKLTKRNLKLNRKRTIGTIIGIVLSVALICALSGLFNSFQETLIQNAINERGNFHIALEKITKEQKQMILKFGIKIVKFMDFIVVTNIIQLQILYMKWKAPYQKKEKWLKLEPIARQIRNESVRKIKELKNIKGGNNV